MQCPSCQNEINVLDKDFGALFTCPLCQSVYFINFDGTADYSEVEQPTAEELQKLQNLSQPTSKKSKAKNNFDFESAVENFIESPAESPIESAVDNPAESIAQNTLETIPEFTNFANEVFAASSEISATEPSFADVAHELENFGNQDVIVSGITYDLEVTGLDTKETQTLFKEALDDQRLGWHTEDLLREMHTGRCVLKNLTPVQAYVIGRRIQFIDVDMKWTQNAIV